MKTFLIVGIETVVGANLVASWSEQDRLLGISAISGLKLPGCETVNLERNSVAGIDQCLQQSRATHVVFCGEAARSTWETRVDSFANADAELWATSAAKAGSHFTMISSDAVFTGPWMFHNEDCKSLCESPEAAAIRQIETCVLTANAKSLIIRTNAFGWSPLGENGWLESLLAALENNSPLELDPLCYATPILASDLADYLAPALEDELTGVFHIAGAERVSPYLFAKQLASAFEFGSPATRAIRELSSRPRGFGCGESSLQTRRFRSEYDCSMPMLSEGLTRLAEQHRSGDRNRLCVQSPRPGRAA